MHEQVFGKWVFNDNVQCRAASPDTAVCADTSISAAETHIEAVIPWLGGDYNPWYVRRHATYSVIIITTPAHMQNMVPVKLKQCVLWRLATHIGTGDSQK